MLKKLPIKIVLLLGNLIPFLHAATIVIPFFLDLDLALKFLFCAIAIYALPPLLARAVYGFRPPFEGTFLMDSAEFKVWWIATQFQSVFMRFTLFEEVLRIIPYAYSGWLRLWGSEIGQRVYWAPKLIVLDRTHLKIGSDVIVGFGAGFTSHHLNRKKNVEESEADYILVLAKPQVGNSAIMGGQSGLGPGARLADYETLPATLPLAPFYEWRNGRRYSLQTPLPAATIHDNIVQ